MIIIIFSQFYWVSLSNKIFNLTGQRILLSILKSFSSVVSFWMSFDFWRMKVWFLIRVQRVLYIIFLSKITLSWLPKLCIFRLYFILNSSPTSLLFVFVFLLTTFNSYCWNTSSRVGPSPLCMQTCASLAQCNGIYMKVFFLLPYVRFGKMSLFAASKSLCLYRNAPMYSTLMSD